MDLLAARHLNGLGTTAVIWAAGICFVVACGLMIGSLLSPSTFTLSPGVDWHTISARPATGS
jgi:hypothetical protein